MSVIPSAWIGIVNNMIPDASDTEWVLKPRVEIFT